MALTTFTAGDAMDRAAALLNDSGKAIFTYAAQIPHIQTAWDEIKEKLEEVDYPMFNETSASLHVVAGEIDIGGSTGPALPSDLIELQQLWERTWGTTEDFFPMSRMDYLPKITTAQSNLIYWAWMGQVVRFITPGATTDREILIDYVGDGLGPIVDQTTVIPLLNAKNALAFRTAALCAQFIGENKTRADDLNEFASSSFETLINNATKRRQAITTRRRPFRAGFKARSIM